MPSSMLEDCPISKRSADAPRHIRPLFPTSPSRWRPCVFMTSSALSSWWCGMRTTDLGDAARIELLLAELRLPAIKPVWASLAAQADKEGWPAGRFLAALAEHEIAERARPHGSSPWAEGPRLERHLAEARLPPGKTLDTFDFEAVPLISKAQVMALAAGDAWFNN